MPDKLKPLGICDLCGGPIPVGDWWTSKGKPRLHCSLDCRNKANSQAGEAIRYRKMMERIARGEWENPAELRAPTSEEQAERARKGRKREVAEGRWRNPALEEAAREKLSRPRKHDGALSRAIESLSQGIPIGELVQEEQDAYREYRRSLVNARREVINQQARKNYRKRKMNDE